ncbi:MAG: tetratricopeptide repeat protein [Thermotogae bacterium]|nr:tetratricopeptide repeat protein [Thermotogota bacterium]
MKSLVEFITPKGNYVVTELSPFVLMIRDYLYGGSWKRMKNNVELNGVFATEMDALEGIEQFIGETLGGYTYEPFVLSEFLDVIKENGLSIDSFVDVDPEALYLFAQRYADEMGTEKTVEVLKILLKFTPNYAHFYELLGSLYVEMGNYNLGEKNLLKSIELDPKLVESYSELGEMYYNLENYEDAIRYWKKEIELSPQNRFTYFMLSDAYKKLHRYEDAINIMKELCREDERNILARYKLAALYREIGDEKRAKEYENEILYLKPYYNNDVEVWAKIQFKYGKCKETEDVLLDYIKRYPLDAHLKLLLIVPYVKAGKYKEANKILDEFRSSKVWYYYGKRELFNEFLTDKERQSLNLS